MSGSGRRQKNLRVHFPLNLDGGGNQEFGEMDGTPPAVNVDQLYDSEPDSGSVDGFSFLASPPKSIKLPTATEQVLAATCRRESRHNEIRSALEQILKPVTGAITLVAEIASSNADIKERSELTLILEKIRDNLAVEAINVKNKFNDAKLHYRDSTVTITDYTPYKNLLNQSTAVNTLVDAITKKPNRDSQLKAIADFRKTISWGVFATEMLKRLFIMLLGAAIGFVTLGYATAPAEAATAAIACGVGPFVGAGLGALAGNFAYKHGLFGVMANEYRLVYAGGALVDRRNPEQGCLGVVKRGLSKF